MNQRILGECIVYRGVTVVAVVVERLTAGMTPSCEGESHASSGPFVFGFSSGSAPPVRVPSRAYSAMSCEPWLPARVAVSESSSLVVVSAERPRAPEVVVRSVVSCGTSVASLETTGGSLSVSAGSCMLGCLWTVGERVFESDLI